MKKVIIQWQDQFFNWQHNTTMHHQQSAYKAAQNRASNQMPGLIIGRSCPWAHRAWIIHEIKGLKKSINLHIAQVDKEGGRWRLDPPIKGCKTLQELYQKCGNHQSRRATVPMLFDPGKEPESKLRLINNESAELVEILNNWPIYDHEIDLNPSKYKKQIINWQNLIQENINNGVYKCGFARNQKAYEKASKNLFSTLNIIEEHLQSNGPWLCGKNLSIADIRLFPTLIRWEAIYYPLFKCSNKSIKSYSSSDGAKFRDWLIEQGMGQYPPIRMYSQYLTQIRYSSVSTKAY